MVVVEAAAFSISLVAIWSRARHDGDRRTQCSSVMSLAVIKQIILMISLPT
jgi:hypothetical protein